MKQSKGLIKRKQATSKERASHDILSGILIVMLSCKQRSKDEASQPQQENALDHKCYSSHMGEEWNSNGIHWSSPSLKLDFTLLIGVMTWNLCDYPLLQQSKGIIVMCMIISFLTSMLLVHIVHAS